MSVPPNRYHDPMDWPRPGLWIATGLLLLSVGCGPSGMEDDRFLLVPNDRKDAHSYSNPEQVRLTRVELEWIRVSTVAKRVIADRRRAGQHGARNGGEAS